MTRVLHFFVAMVAMAAVCSGQVVVRNHLTGAPITTPLLLPDVGVNGSEAIALDVVNTGSNPVTIESAAVTGLYYSLCCNVGFVLPPNASQTITLTFAPTQTGYFSGALQLDNLAIFIFGHSIATPSVFIQTSAGLVQALSGKPLILTEDTPFSGQFAGLLENNSNGPVMVQSFTASGDLSVAFAPVFPLLLAAGEQAGFTLKANQSGGGTTLSGIVNVDQFSYAIEAHPPAPAIHINLPNGPLQSGQQVALSITFDSAPTQVLAGSIALTLQTVAPVELSDPAILFTSTGAASATFESVVGQLNAQFNGQSSLTFQTGTTEGSLHIIATWGFSQDEVDVPLAPSPVVIETLTAARASSSLAITVTGYDNTRTAGNLSFSFFDSRGAYIGTPVAADFTELFYNYFFQTSYNAGGMFKMTAQFPVTGGTGSISSVQVNLMNSAGNSPSAITHFQ